MCKKAQRHTRKQEFEEEKKKKKKLHKYVPVKTSMKKGCALKCEKINYEWFHSNSKIWFKTSAKRCFESNETNMISDERPLLYNNKEAAV